MTQQSKLFAQQRKKLAQGCLDYLADIPEEKWCKNQLLARNGNRCAIGHLLHSYPESFGLSLIDPSNIQLKLDSLWLRKGIISANDYGRVNVSPKERVINFLIDVVEGKK